ncbi:hypothetical protein J2W42_004256 [Rhizobium tibeticum]|nr:hypothetical protein [Rhizobium tibeticum]
MIPNVGDYVQIEPLGGYDAPQYAGKVKSRLFQETCGINIWLKTPIMMTGAPSSKNDLGP